MNRLEEITKKTHLWGVENLSSSPPLHWCQPIEPFNLAQATTHLTNSNNSDNSIVVVVDDDDDDDDVDACVVEKEANDDDIRKKINKFLFITQ